MTFHTTKYRGTLMLDALVIVGEIIQVAAGLTGLMLVFLGNALAGLGAFHGFPQKAVRTELQTRAWFASWGLVVSVLALSIAVIAQWSGLNGLAIMAGLTLFAALGWAALSAASMAAGLLTARPVGAQANVSAVRGRSLQSRPRRRRSRFCP